MCAEIIDAQAIERLDKQRNRALTWFIGTFLLWIFCSIAYTVIDWISGGLEPELQDRLSMYLVAIPAIPWLCFILRYRRLRRRITNTPEVAAALDDEIVQQAWTYAAAKGFWAMLAVEIIFEGGLGFYQAFMGTPNLSFLWDSQSIMAITIGLSVTIVTFLRARQSKSYE